MNNLCANIQIYVIYVASNRIKIVQSLEGRFEESVIAYLFLVNILPICIIPMIWIETKKVAQVLNDWTDFEVISIIFLMSDWVYIRKFFPHRYCTTKFPIDQWHLV